MKCFLLALIRFYRKYISPAFPGKCRFIPTCSEYGIEAIEKYGAAKGSWLTFKRLLRCNPFNHAVIVRLPPRRLPHPAAQAAFQEEFNGIYPHPLWLSVGVPL